MLDKASLVLIGRMIRIYFWPTLGISSTIMFPIFGGLIEFFDERTHNNYVSFLTVMTVTAIMILIATGIGLFFRLRIVQRLYRVGQETIGIIDKVNLGRTAYIRYRYVYGSKIYQRSEELSLFVHAYELSKAIHKENFYIKLLVDPTDPQIAIIPSLYTSTGKDRLEFVNPVSFETVANLMSSNSRHSNPTISTTVNTDKRSYIDKLRNHTR